MDRPLTFEITGDARAACALRRSVFVEEMGIAPEIEADSFDATSEHAILRDPGRPELGAIGTARLARGTAYTAREFDLHRLCAAEGRVVELGRTCLHPDYRGGTAALTLFRGIAEQLLQRGVAYLVGTASLPGTDAAALMPVLRGLRDAALAPEELRPRARGPQAVAVTAGAGDLRAAPPLIKAYLRAGAWVGEGAWIDADFGCTDICILLDMARLRLPGAGRRAPLGSVA
ncbi:GNAT family N-acetyltransferase [Jannaschia seohaensis]|uniref:L-ornithine N(alpha)-acyltransferase n=1 Tax=Jannaschia seohaensis TaxID=475081 RepID=A0A2Y9AFZ6_9RHOB|nr:GNAT family N-acetyltransferase [Jannaschia seohaensis]PWJ20837.1 putative hemolysin [Jannaschia seohaensis]SSA41247.1 Putative hemolysin [Jannaschia seohaensis]